ncbi:MAG: hypothetical protein LRY51_08410 [Geovibrio sp.]|nr:hypothetical protein [Geovibrio sp.]
MTTCASFMPVWGDVHCPSCGKKVESYSVQQIVDFITSHPDDARVEIYSPIVRGKKRRI